MRLTPLFVLSSLLFTSPANAADKFSFSLYGEAKGTKGNVLVSGTSVRGALGLAAIGAKGDTAKELTSVLALDSAADDWSNAKGKATLQIANRVWADDSLAVDPGFLSKAGAERLSFGDSERARTTINGWVSKNTDQHITNLVPTGALGSDTRLVITNAVYFKGKWATRFDKADTRDEAFEGTGKVPTMHATQSFSYAHRDGASVLEMPYADSDIVMDVVLPDAKDGFSAIEKNLTADQFGTWTKSFSSERVAVSLPRVKFEYGGSLKPALEKLGIKSAFSNHADFSGIASRENLKVSDVIQRAFVSIDEEGTEAAAATAVTMADPSAAMPQSPIAFNADHPFVFAIRDRKHDRILFVGRVEKP